MAGAMGSVEAKEKAEEASIEFFPSPFFVLTDWEFRRMDPGKEYLIPEANQLSKWKIRFKDPAFFVEETSTMLRFMLSFQFSLKTEITCLRCLITTDSGIFEEAFVGEKFPREINENSFLTGGLMETEIPPLMNTEVTRSFDFFIPKVLTERRLFIFVLEDNNLVLGKSRCDFAMDPSLGLARASTAKKERFRRLEGISILNQLMGQDFQNILRLSSAISRPKSQFIEAEDGTRLAFRSYQTRSFCQAVLVLSSPTSFILDPLADKISKASPIIVKIVEVRGYGDSAGKRGTSERTSSVWRDIKSFLLNFRLNHPELPIFLGGHHTHAGMALNYAGWLQREPADGYVFISPDFGVEFSKPERINKFHTDVKAKYNWGALLLSNLTGGYLSGTRTAYQYEYPEILYKFVPNLVDSVSTNNVRACTPYNARTQLMSLLEPYGVWVGEDDEFLNASKIIDMIKEIAKESCMFELTSHATHFGVLLNISENLGNWMLDISNSSMLLTSAVSGELDLLSESTETFRKKIQKSMLDLSQELLTAVMDLRLHQKKQSYLVAMDGAALGYTTYIPKAQKPGACLVFLGGIEKSLPCHILCEKYNVVVFSFIGRSSTQDQIPSREAIWSDIRSLIRHVKFHFPNLFLLLGGHGLGATMAVNYATWKQREPVGGYVLISPTFSPARSSENDRQFISSTAEKHQDIFISESPSWILAPGLLDPEKSGELFNQNREFLGACLATDFIDQIKQIVDVPVGVWIGSHDEITNGSKLVEVLSQNQQVNLSQTEIIQGATHFGALMTAAFQIGPWIERFVQMLVPSLLRLENPKIEDFKQLQILGRGAYGKVYLVQHIETGKFFAMKTLRKAEIQAVGEREIDYVVNERNLLRDVNSPWVVAYVGSFQTDKLLCILMEYVIGGELFTYLRLETRFESERARFYAAELVLFLENLHEREVVYRDMKPENILLDSMGHIKVTDMGFAKSLKGGKKTNSFCGTIDYLAPEVLEKRDYGISCDYWALGIMIFELLCGYPPFTDSNKNTIIRRILFGEVEFEDHVDPHAQDLILRLLLKNPKKRLGTGPGGIEDIKNHRWFRGISWEQLANKEVPSPFIPRFSHEGDSSNYLVVDENDEAGPAEKDSYGEFFKDF